MDALNRELTEHIDSAEANEVLDEATLNRMKGLPSADSREMVLRLKVGHADIVNGNGRLYPKALLKREVESLQEKLNNRQIFANDQHPLRRVGASGKVENVDRPTFGSTTFIPYLMEMNEEGEIFSVGVVPKTDAGRNYAAVIRAGGRPGVSTRGFGSSKKQTVTVKGAQVEALVVQDDFKLRTFDTVIDQSVPDAGIMSIAESHQEPPAKSAITSIMNWKQWCESNRDAMVSLTEAVAAGTITLADLKNANGIGSALYPALRQQVAEELEPQVQAQLLEKYDAFLVENKEAITEEVLDTARAEGVAVLAEALGLPEELLVALDENEELAEALRSGIAGLFDETGGDEQGGNGEGAGSSNESLDEAIASNPAVKALQEQLEESQRQTSQLLVQNRVVTLKAEFPYGAELFEAHFAKPLSQCDSLEEANEFYTAQVGMLKAAGAKAAAPAGQARFLPKDAAKTTPLAESEDDNGGSSASLDEELINGAAASLVATSRK